MSGNHIRNSRIDGLQTQQNILIEKIARLRSSLATETDTAVKFKLEHQIHEAEAERRGIENLIQDLEGSQSVHDDNFFLLNRILLSLLVALSLFTILIVFSSIADAVIAAIGVLAGLVTFLFPTVKLLYTASWFRTLTATIILVILAILQLVLLLLWFFREELSNFFVR